MGVLRSTLLVTFMKPNTEGLTAVKLIVDSDEAAEFLLRAQQKTGCKTYKMP